VATLGNRVATGLGDGVGLPLTDAGMGAVHPTMRAAATMR
jgi:hypothetical protein